MRKTILALLLAITSVFLISCKNNHYEYVEGKINITATTNIMGDLAKSIGKDTVSVYSLMGAGVDPHGYIPRPNDYRALSEADIILVSGLHLEAKMGEVFKEYERNKIVVSIGDQLLTSTLGDKVIESEDFGDNYDPHFWFDIPLYKEAAIIFADALINIDPLNKEYYTNNLDEYLIALDNLSNDVHGLLTTLKDVPRILVSAHDAFAYLNLEYNFTVYALQGLSTEDEISPSDIREITNIVIENKVRAIFPETSVPIETIISLSESIKNHAHGYKITIGNNLYSDSMGNNDDDNTYIKMYLKNINTIVSALLGNGE